MLGLLRVPGPTKLPALGRAADQSMHGNVYRATAGKAPMGTVQDATFVIFAAPMVAKLQEAEAVQPLAQATRETVVGLLEQLAIEACASSFASGFTGTNMRSDGSGQSSKSSVSILLKVLQSELACMDATERKRLPLQEWAAADANDERSMKVLFSDKAVPVFGMRPCSPPRQGLSSAAGARASGSAAPHAAALTLLVKQADHEK
jgi:hypothetical protein